MEQTLKDIEIIVIDDCSTDNTKSIIEEMKAKDKRIKSIYLPKNSGAGVARNKGIEAAVGEYIGFIDSDDYVDKGYFEELYSNALTIKYDIIRGIRVIDASNKHAKHNPYGCIVPSIINRQFIIKNKLRFPQTKGRGEDSTFKRWCYLRMPKIYECKDNKIYYHYMRREGSLSNYKL
jgi:glycosyltransferase involved in cell wall biosynthesis